MSIDLSGIIGDSLERTLGDARRLHGAGELKKAATAYAQAAKLMAKHAKNATGEAVKTKRLADAKQLQSLAEQLRQGKDVSNAKPSQKSKAIQDKEAIGGEDGGYWENARSLIKQAKVSWDDIAGLEDIGRFVKESYVLALARRPDGVGLPRAANLLLYGPPGTGKTLIAAAISNGLDATFFSCKISDILSKYFGESSKLIGAVFELAAEMNPSVIFLDDFESLVADRDGQSSGSERRVLTELLTNMDGFENKGADAMVLVVAATNKPWLVDNAVLSRFGKLAYVGLPDKAAREKIFALHLSSQGYPVAGTLADFAGLTDGYSGRELEQISKELIRQMISRVNPDMVEAAEMGKEALAKYELKVSDITIGELEAVLRNMRPMTDATELQRFERWGNSSS